VSSRNPEVCVGPWRKLGHQGLRLTARTEKNRLRGPEWRRFGPYLSERAWGTVREDCGADGDAWVADMVVRRSRAREEEAR